MNNLQEERFKDIQEPIDSHQEKTFKVTCKTIATALFILMFVNLLANFSLSTIFQLAGNSRLQEDLRIFIITITTIASTIFVIDRYTKKLHVTIQQDAITKNIPFRKYVFFILVTLGITFLFTLGINLVDATLRALNIQLSTLSLGLQKSMIYNITLLLLICVIVPISEELIFRGLILSSLKRYGTTFAVLTTSLLFALIHRNFIQALPTFILSLCLCYIVLKTNSIYASIWMHILNNSYAMAFIIFKENAIVTPIFAILTIVIILLAIIIAIINRKTIHHLIFSKHKTKVRYFFGNWISILLLLTFIYYFIRSVSILS